MLKTPDDDTVVGDESPLEKVKIIDTGCMNENTLRYKRDDFYHFISAAVHLRNALFNDRKLYVNAIEFIEDLDKLNDYDDIIRTWDADQKDRDIFDIIMNSLQAISIDPKTYNNNKHLTQPFEAMSVEYFSSNQLIVDLFVKNNSWYKEIVSKEPTILTGPRGCGKSMVFRYLATDTHLQTKNCGIDKLENIPFLGIYINCSQDLQSYLYWINDEVSSDNKEHYRYYHDGLITFFSLLMCSKLVLTLYKISLRLNILEKYQTSEAKIQNMIRSIVFRIGITKKPILYGSSEILNLCSTLDSMKFKIHSALLRKDGDSTTKLPLILDESFILDISKSCYENLNESHPIVFLLDDYTYGRVPENIQKIFNKIIWQRTYYQHFKISSEKLNFTTLNSNGITADQGREYEEIDTGYHALSDKKSKEGEFIIDMLDARFKSANWKGRVETLIGLSKYPSHKKLKDKIITISEEEKEKGRSCYYYGIQIIANLWTGDTATILQMVKKNHKKSKLKKQ